MGKKAKKKKKSNWKPPKGSSAYFYASSDDDFKAKHPIGYFFLVLLMRAMRKIKARNVHSCTAHGCESFFVVRSRTYSTYYFCFAHDITCFLLSFNLNL